MDSLDLKLFRQYAGNHLAALPYGIKIQRCFIYNEHEFEYSTIEEQ